MTWRWPLQDRTPLFPDEPGTFGVARKFEHHTGIDLYADRGTKVVAVENGVVVLIEVFTGPLAPDPSPWWNNTQAALIEGASGVVTYGEITALVEVGQLVKAGDVVGVIEEPVLRRFKGRPMSMLHLELSLPGTRKTYWGWLDQPLPKALLDPTPKLREAAGPDAEQFNLATYDGLRFR